MPTRQKLIRGAAASLALAGAGVAGATFGTPALSGAQDAPTDTTVDSTEVAPPADGAQGEGRRGSFGHRERLAAAAEALGVTEEELLAALQDGSSIADVAEAQGVDVQTVVDALIADGTERLAELEASLPDRVTALVNREGLPERGPRGPGPGRGAPTDATDTTEDGGSA